MQGALRLALAALLLPLAGCPFAPPQEGYTVRAPTSGPSKLAPSGYRWQQSGNCTVEEKRSVYNADTEAHTLCDWVIAREAPPAPAGCTKDTDCKGDRICVIAGGSEGSCQPPRATPSPAPGD